jgi:hypothetical protein
MGMTFRTVIQLSGKTATGIEIPPDVIDALDGGKKPPVRVTIEGYTYQSTVASRGGRYLVGINAENRERAGVSAGDTVDVGIELDTGSRELPVPPDLAEALRREPAAEAFFATLTPSQRKWFILDIEGAKKPETRQRRVEKAVSMLREKRKR